MVVDELAPKNARMLKELLFVITLCALIMNDPRDSANYKRSMDNWSNLLASTYDLIKSKNVERFLFAVVKFNFICRVQVKFTFKERSEVRYVDVYK